MVGPFMQGLLLMGLMYWYSKGMMSLISDYYRTEFQRKIKLDDRLQNRTTYDTDDIGRLIETENLLHFNGTSVGVVEKSASSQIPIDQPGWKAEGDQEEENQVCSNSGDMETFMQFIKEYSKPNGNISPWTFPVCAKDPPNKPDYQTFPNHNNR